MLYAKWGTQTTAVAAIGGLQYQTLQDAIDAVPTTDTSTTIILLKNVALSQVLTIAAHKEIVFNLQNYTISNAITAMPIIENSGTISISNGTIASTATQGAINNKNGGKLYISGGRIEATGTRQAIYNASGGFVEISGSAYLSATTNERAPVQNLKGGTINIKGGTIVSTAFSAVDNAGTLTIGIKDGNVSTTSPVLQGTTYAINNTSNASSTFKFYDGILKYKIDKFDTTNVSVAEIETGTGFLHDAEVIGGENYQTAHLGAADTVTFDPRGGNITEPTRSVVNGGEVGPLPTPTKSGFDFVGWFTQINGGGTQVTANTIITGNITFYAHWQKVDIAEINGTRYATLKAAIDAVAQDNVQVTIDLINDTTENVTIKANQNIVLNLQNHTMRNTVTTAVIENNGTVTVTNGTITSNVNTAVINNNLGGHLTIDGASIISTGTRQAIYNNGGGTVEIKGNAYLSSTATGKPTNSSMERGTVQNLANGILIISGGTIIGVNQQAVSNEGTLTIGTTGGGVSITVPEIRGKTYGVKSTSTFNFYDGILKGITDPVNGSISNVETGYQKEDSTEVIDGKTYKTAYLIAE